MKHSSRGSTVVVALVSSLALAAAGCSSGKRSAPAGPAPAAAAASGGAASETAAFPAADAFAGPRPETVTDDDVKLVRTLLASSMQLATQIRGAGADCVQAMSAIDAAAPRLQLLHGEIGEAFPGTEEQLWLGEVAGPWGDEVYATLAAAPCHQDAEVRKALRCCIVHRSELTAEGYKPVDGQPMRLTK